MGGDREAAAKAGLRVARVVTICFVISAGCAAVGGFVSVTQIGAVGPSYAAEIEFSAIAAAVLGGRVPLRGGGAGSWAPSSGRSSSRRFRTGSTSSTPTPTSTPLVTATIIFLAVAIDGLRTRIIDRMERRHIRPVTV